MGNRSNVPELRFSEFASTGSAQVLEDWEKKPLGQLGYFKNGFNADKTAFGSGTEFINLMDIFGKGEIKKTQLDRVEINEKQLDHYKIKKGDVLFVRSSVKRTGVGQSCLVNDDFVDTVYSGFIIRFRQKSNELYHQYQKYCFSTIPFRKKLLSLATSSANTNINQESLVKIILSYPSLPEQQKIATFLSAVDKKLGLLRHKHTLLKLFKRGMMQQIFSQKIRFVPTNASTCFDKAQYDSSAHVRSKVAEPVEAFPDWEEKRLGDIGSFQGGGTPKTNVEEYWKGDIPWVSSSDLEEGDIHDISISRFINKKTIQESATKIIPKKSILLISRVGVGKLAVSLREVCTSQDFANFTPNSDNVHYIAYYLLFNKNKLLSFSQGTSIKGFTTGDIGSFKIRIPCLLEQQKIANFLSTLDKKLEAVQKHLY